MMEATERQLRDEVDMLRERLRQLERVIGVPATVPKSLGLRPLEAKVLSHLIRVPEATKESMMLALYSDNANNPPAPEVVAVVVCRLRKLLKPRGMDIETLWGRGYKLPNATKRQLTWMMEEENG